VSAMATKGDRFTISNNQGRTGSSWQGAYATCDEAGEALKEAMSWSRLVLVPLDDELAYAGFPNWEAVDETRRSGVGPRDAPRIHVPADKWADENARVDEFMADQRAQLLAALNRPDVTVHFNERRSRGGRK